MRTAVAVVVEVVEAVAEWQCGRAVDSGSSGSGSGQVGVVVGLVRVVAV